MCHFFLGHIPCNLQIPPESSFIFKSQNLILEGGDNVDVKESGKRLVIVVRFSNSTQIFIVDSIKNELLNKKYVRNQLTFIL